MWWRPTKSRDYWENFEESETKVKSKTIWFKENILKIEKKFRCEKTSLKLGTNFWDSRGSPTASLESNERGRAKLNVPSISASVREATCGGCLIRYSTAAL